MIKNFRYWLFVIGICIFTQLTVSAETLKVEAVSEFSTANPTKTMKVKLTEDVLYDNVELEEGYLLVGEVVDIKAPKRLKRNAKFSFIPEHYVDNSGVYHNFETKHKGKYSLPIDSKGLAKNATLSVGNYFVKGLTLGVNAVQGAVQNEEGNRLKSAGKNVYENSPLSYVETGNEIELHQGDRFYIKFGRDAKEDDEENVEESEDINNSSDIESMPQ